MRQVQVWSGDEFEKMEVWYWENCVRIHEKPNNYYTKLSFGVVFIANQAGGLYIKVDYRVRGAPKIELRRERAWRGTNKLPASP